MCVIFIAGLGGSPILETSHSCFSAARLGRRRSSGDGRVHDLVDDGRDPFSFLVSRRAATGLESGQYDPRTEPDSAALAGRAPIQGAVGFWVSKVSSHPVNNSKERPRGLILGF